MIGLLLFFVGSSVYLFFKYKSTTNKTEVPETSEPLTLTQKVSKLVILPNGEEPRIITVASIEEIKNEPFFKNAQVGDSVLVYINAKKAYLYRESENRVVDIAPIIVNTEPVASTTETVKDN